MTFEELNEKWDQESFNEACRNKHQYREYVDDCFSAYEEGGFMPRFSSPYKQMERFNGLPFKVVRRCDERDWDLESLPAWVIQFESGARMDALPEEICKSEVMK